jgi:protein-disulfide isomerase
MASRAEQKQQARAQREAIEREAQQSAARRRRLYGLGGAVAIAAVIVVVAIAISSGGSSKPKTNGAGKGDVAAVTALLRGIPQAGNRLGNPSAPVTVDYYGDLECPVCRDFTLGALPQLISKEVRAGKVKLRYRSLQTATSDPSTFRLQQIAALAAGKQRRLWQFVELFYRQQGEEGTGYVTGPYLQRIAEQVPGLDLAGWTSARDDAALASEVGADSTDAGRIGANATPWLHIAGPKGTRALSGNVSYTDLTSDVSAVSS